MDTKDKLQLPPAEGLFDRIIQFSICNAIWVMLFVVAWIGVGIYSYQKLSIDAVPDITNVQVQINSQAGGFTAPRLNNGLLIRLKMPCRVFRTWNKPVPSPVTACPKSR